MRELLERLRNSKRPLLHVGHGVRIAKAIHILFQLLGRVRIPVVTARNGNDIIASDHPLFVGRPGTFAQRGANFAVQSCDLYIAVGTRLCLAQTGYNAKDYARNAYVVQVDIDEAELNKDTCRVDLKIRNDAGAFLYELFEHAQPQEWPEWLAHCKRLQAKYPPVTDEQRNQKNYVNSYALIDKLSDLLTPEDIIVTDMGFAFQNTHQAFRVKQGQRLFTNGGTAAMGWGLPAAIGAAIGTGRRVILIAGDGGMMMNIQELATLAHHNLNVKIFLLNNGGYLTMKQSQKVAFGSYMGSDESTGLGFPDFRALAKAFRIGSSQHSDLASVELNSLGPWLYEIMMDPDQEQIPKSINRRLPDGTIQQTAIEDAYPFLDPKEIEENLCAP